MSGEYTVHWKRQGEWVQVFKHLSPFECALYAKDKIVHGHITERIEIRDSAGDVLDTVYDSSW
jgi:hypothetical protein